MGECRTFTTQRPSNENHRAQGVLSRHYPRASQRGVALAILVWFLAAMSILVAGIVMQARVDIKLAQLHADVARVEAAADGAMQLALADLKLREVNGEFSPRAVSYASHTLGDRDVLVSFTPLAGLVDLNLATQELLFALFDSIDDVDEATADELSSNVVKWRAPNPMAWEQGSQVGEESGDISSMSTARYGRFEVIEDLLLVEGLDRRIFEAIRDSVYVDPVGQPGVDWVAAPVSVLRALGGMNEVTAMELAASRMTTSAEELVAPKGLDLAFQATAELSSYRVDALVVYGDTVYRRRRWVDRAMPGADGLPWRFIRTEAVTALPSDDFHSLAMREGIHAGN